MSEKKKVVEFKQAERVHEVQDKVVTFGDRQIPLYFGIGFLKLVDTHYGLSPDVLSEFNTEDLKKLGFDRLSNTGIIRVYMLLQNYDLQTVKDLLMFATAQNKDKDRLNSQEWDEYIFSQVEDEEAEERFFEALVALLKTLPKIGRLVNDIDSEIQAELENADKE